MVTGEQRFLEVGAVLPGFGAYPAIVSDSALPSRQAFSGRREHCSHALAGRLGKMPGEECLEFVKAVFQQVGVSATGYKNLLQPDQIIAQGLGLLAGESRMQRVHIVSGIRPRGFFGIGAKGFPNRRQAGAKQSGNTGDGRFTQCEEGKVIGPCPCIVRHAGPRLHTCPLSKQ